MMGMNIRKMKAIIFQIQMVLISKEDKRKIYAAL